MAITLDQRLVRRFEAWRDPAAKAALLGRFVGYAMKRFMADGCPRQAAGLGYISLLSIVPLLAIALGLLSAFPAFESIRVELQSMIFTNFLPGTSSEITEQLTFFVDNASKATGPGTIGFAITAVLLLNNINDALNTIWRVPEPRPIALRLLVYWALLTLGPLLLGSSISLSSYAFAMVEWSGIESYAGALVELSRVISVVLSTFGFALLYFVVPNRGVRVRHALLGGFVAALLFEVLKSGFGIYLRSFGSYQVIYGALSAVPVFLLWMYLFWAVVLLGAVTAAALPEWRAAVSRGRHAVGPGEQLALALALLARLRKTARHGGAMRERHLVRDLPATPAEIDTTLRKLRRAGIVERSIGSRWVLARDLTTLQLGQLAERLTLDLDPGKGWPGEALTAIAGLLEAGRPQLERSLEELLAEAEDKSSA